MSILRPLSFGVLSPSRTKFSRLKCSDSRLSFVGFEAHLELPVPTIHCSDQPHWPRQFGPNYLEQLRRTSRDYPEFGSLRIRVCCALHFIIYLFEINFYFFCSFFRVPASRSNRNLITLEISEAATASLAAEAIEAIRRSAANR